MDDGKVWFAPKRYGYGAGLPVRWQGWAVLAAFFAAIGLAEVAAVHGHWLIFAAIVVVAVVILIIVAARRTRGGWRWRWGDAP